MVTCPTKIQEESYKIGSASVTVGNGDGIRFRMSFHWVFGPEAIYGPFDTPEEAETARVRLELLNQSQF